MTVQNVQWLGPFVPTYSYNMPVVLYPMLGNRYQARSGTSGWSQHKTTGASWSVYAYAGVRTTLELL